MTLRLMEYKLIFKSYADCLGMFLTSAKHNGGDGEHSCNVAYMIFDPKGFGQL